MATSKKTVAKASKNSNVAKKVAASKNAKVAPAKKVAKAPAKKAVAKTPVKKAVVVAKKSVAKPVAKTTAKKVATKPSKPSVAKTPAKASKPVAKSSPQKVAAKKATAIKQLPKKAATKKSVAAKKTVKPTAVKTISKAVAAKKVPAKVAKAVPTKTTVAPQKTTAASAKVAAKKADSLSAKTLAKAIPAKKVATKLATASHSGSSAPGQSIASTIKRMTQRDENKPVVIVAHRKLENKSKKESDVTTQTDIFQPKKTSILDPIPMTNNESIKRYSDDELLEFKELILARIEAARKELAYLQGLITRKDEAGTDDTENRYASIEDGSGAMEREQLAQMASRQIQFVGHLEKALMRIENKTYGICRVTGKLIDKARLRAVPHATLSIEAKNTMNK